MNDPTTNTTAAPLVSGGRHPVNVAHLVMGAAFLCIVAGWALVQGDVVTGGDIRWLLPIPWLVAGAAGLAAITVTNLRKAQPVQPGQPVQPVQPIENEEQS